MIMTEIKYPNVTVQLTGHDGNAFFVIGRVRQALREAGVSEEEISEFTAQEPPALTMTMYCGPSWSGWRSRVRGQLGQSLAEALCC